MKNKRRGFGGIPIKGLTVQENVGKEQRLFIPEGEEVLVKLDEMLE